jgi:hypothetical protein
MTASWFGADTRSTEYSDVAPIVATPGRLALDRLVCCLSTGRRPPDVGCRSAPAGRETELLLRKKENDVKNRLTKKAPYEVDYAAMSSPHMIRISKSLDY